MPYDLKALTTKKVSGIPVIYLLLGVVAIALFGAFKMKPSKTAAADTTGTDAGGDLPDTSQPVFSATPTITQETGTAGSVSSTAMPDTDTLWSRRAIDYLRQHGFSLDIATSAINKYLAGEPLTSTEARARDMAVGVYGLPPESVPDTSTLSTPTTPSYTGPAAKQGSPPTVHTVRGTSDDSYEELARLYYGTTSSGEDTLIRSYNTYPHGPFPKGSRITIPVHITPRYYVATSATHTAIAIAQKNGTTRERIIALNPNKTFPVSAGTRVRVR